MTKYIVFLLLIIVVLGCKNKTPNETRIRPENFPEFLRPPENADNILYAGPETGNTDYRVYTLSYFVNESFPPQKTMKFVYNLLADSGYFLLKYTLLDHQEAHYVWQFDDYSDPGFVRLKRGERWASKNNNGFVMVIFNYRNKIGESDLSRLAVSINYSLEESKSSVSVKKYKTHFPEEDWAKKFDEIEYDNIREN